ncbi:hypothetical protein Efla_006654 [Eimeria flavescens]
MQKQTATQRELYYKSPDIFDSQQQVNLLLQLPRASLSVFASERAWTAAPVRLLIPLLFESGDAAACGIAAGSGVMISEALLEADELRSTASYILVVEKDAIFQSLCHQEFWNAGYVGDYDPHGMQIFLTYQSGSKSFDGKQLAFAALKWIGLRREDTEALPAAARMRLGKRDWSLLQGLLEHPGVLSNEQLRTECKRMHAGGWKSEVEALETHGPDYLARNYIATRILRRSWI